MILAVVLTAIFVKNRAGLEVDAVIQDIGFENLPAKVRDQYIKKTDLQNYAQFITPTSYNKKYSVNQSDLDGLSMDQLKILATELGSKNRALIADNLDLADKNLELISKFESLENKFNNKTDEIAKISSDALQRKQAEYDAGISKIKEQLKERENEVLEHAKSYDARIANMQNSLDSLAQSKQELENNLNEKLQNAISLAQSKQLALNEANENIAKLQNALSEAERESSDLKAAIEGADSELKQSNSLFTRELDRINEGFSIQKKALEDALSKKTNELIDTKDRLKQTQDELKDVILQNKDLSSSVKKLNTNLSNLKEQNDRLGNALEQTTASLNLNKQNVAKLSSDLNLSNISVKKLKSELEKSALAYIKLEKENYQLNSDLNTKRSENRELNETIRLKNESLNTQAASMQKQNSKMIEISAKNDSLNTDVKELKEALDKAQGTIRQYRQNYEGALKKLDEQLAQNENLKSKINFDENLSQIGSSISGAFDSFSGYLRSFSLPKEQLEIAQKQNMQKPQKQVLNHSEQAIEDMLNRQDELEDENKNLRLMLDAATKMETPKKLVLVDKVVCEDMGSRNNISPKCKARVLEFLGKYNSNYIYEIVPIIDEKSSALVKAASKGLSSDDAKKIAEYANYGAGRSRALVAAGLVRDEYGDFARISFSSEVILRDGARGFEIRAYK